MSRSGMKRKNVDNGLLENLENSAANPCSTNGPSVVRRGRSKKKDTEDAASNASDANEKTMELPASRQRKNVKEQGIKGGEISTNGDSKAESGTKSTDEVLNPKKRGKTKNNRIEGNLKVADINEESAPVEESEADIAPNLTKPNAVEESKGILQNGSAFSNNAIDPSEESKKPNKRGRKKKLDEKTGAENGKTAEPETEKEDPVVEKLPVKRGRKNLKSTKITEGDSTESVKAATNEKVVPDVKDDENVDDKIKNIVPEKRGRKKVEQIPKEETAKATTKSNSKEKKVKSNENIASKKKHNVPALLDEPLIQENSNNEELLEIETKTNEPADKKKKKNAAKKCPTVDLKDCSVMLKRNESTENALQELASIPLQKKSDEDKSKITKSAEDQDNGESSKGKNKRGQDGSEDDFKPTKPAKVPKKATKSSEPKNIAKTPGIEKLDFSNKSTNSSGKPWNFKISSWNINGVRAWLEKDGLSYINHEKPDIIALQETKCSDDKLPEEVTKIDGYHCYWVAGDKDGYSGVGLLSKQEPIEVKYGIGIDQHDNEGRVITTEYENFFVVAAYVPNAGRGLIRLEYRTQWDKDFRSYLKKLDEKKPVILCGDLNVAHEEIDLANPKTNKKNAGFTKEERDGFSALLEEGFLDTFRHLYPDVKSAYTFWTYMMNARAKNVGWRLDYFVISKRFEDCLCDSIIRKDIYGSDHCPITLFLAV